MKLVPTGSIFYAPSHLLKKFKQIPNPSLYRRSQTPKCTNPDCLEDMASFSCWGFNIRHTLHQMRLDDTIPERLTHVLQVGSTAISRENVSDNHYKNAMMRKEWDTDKISTSKPKCCVDLATIFAWDGIVRPNTFREKGRKRLLIEYTV
ncbi:hypothetical protein PHYBLDRAFT_162639 [Phycomyces blakesleeanus NRRL 1555(-)]|uniref:Uncharacterized protein n=1 Tax=Phycomyces blakesleeanus (strain ATCC 8743b / DSM 1359 / FGSC 10004 / NBRC 33097 / NRRL 1555) TaxID=763407 RepID=A0A162V2X4_PHYB8|nr:hypothetical protein PHYBLDRAFT_162639 [Phycomyces blakesleeanus NRRL 1555(-)]OAD79583.1 hypothetical protein PHYBLDRAFT_162639 [Phycomyces blakesleeanus NRRL 1555(-)]|eukprot:XP_018297623.1 hypothetical protein PHYBLDRAFT_162639 [Phycomyces blakesleeanus NRRL 1555(-)]